MKKINIITAILLLTTVFVSCKKDGVKEVETIKIDGGAQVKFFNFGINAPSMNFYANDQKVSATLSGSGAEATAGVNYGSVFPATNYALLSGGNYTFKGIVSSTATADPNVVVATIPGNLENGKLYSLYTSGPFDATAKTVDGFVVEDNIPAASATNAHVRFVNTIANATAGFDLVAKNTTTAAEIVIATNIGYKVASTFTEVPNGIYEIYARYPGDPANVISRTGTSQVSFIAGRAYTISSRGDMTVTGATATNRPFLDNTSNRP
jgi:hypothetical protein